MRVRKRIPTLPLSWRNDKPQLPGGRFVRCTDMPNATLSSQGRPPQPSCLTKGDKAAPVGCNDSFGSGPVNLPQQVRMLHHYPEAALNLLGEFAKELVRRVASKPLDGPYQHPIAFLNQVEQSDQASWLPGSLGDLQHPAQATAADTAPGRLVTGTNGSKLLGEPRIGANIGDRPQLHLVEC